MTTLVNKLYQSRGVLLEMLKSRKYDTKAYEEFSINEIDIMNRTMPSKPTLDEGPLDFNLKNSEGTSAYIKYLLSPKIRQGAIMNMITDMIGSMSENDTLIIIIKDKINNMEILETYLENFYQKNKVFVQIFWIEKLQINILKHSMVPEHNIISEEEKEELLNKYNIIGYNQLPLILSRDPVAKYLGMKKGDICRIKRPSETSGVYFSYRYCQ